jgi:hypothetical protein
MDLSQAFTGRGTIGSSHCPDYFVETKSRKEERITALNEIARIL